MTRKVSAYCFRKRLLLLPYTNKLFSTRPRYNHPIFERKRGSLIKTTKHATIFPYIVLMYQSYMNAMHASTFLVMPQQKEPNSMWFFSISCAIAVSLWGKMSRQLSVLSVFSARVSMSTMIQIIYNIDYSY